jgi:serine/threonine-protein kinase
MPDLAEGAIFAGHRIEGVAGRGGMGTVYRATHLALDHMVALKVIAPDLAGDDSFRERFKSESRIAVSLRHANVVPIHHAGEEDGLLFVTMDLIDGPDLRKLLVARGPLDPSYAIAILRQVASALDVAHSRGLVHRDIKPGNILIDEREGPDHAYLTDFGLTKRMDQATDVSALTSTGAFVGTLDYVAPEQIRGDRLDARTDVYALGCVLYEMLGDGAPFGSREEKVAKIYAHLQDPPTPLGGELTRFDRVLSRAMAKAPYVRCPSAGDLARAATAALEGGEVIESERSVGIGPAAPTMAYAAVETPDTAEASVAREPEPAPDIEAATELDATEAGPPQPAEPPPTRPSRPAGRSGRRLGLLAAALVLVGAGLAAVLVLGGGDDPAPTGGPGLESGPVGTAGDPLTVGGFPVGVAAGGGGVRAATREGRSLVEVDGETARPVDLGTPVEDTVFSGGVWWATAFDANSVIGVEDGADAPGPRVRVGDEPRGIAKQGAAALWVTNSADNTVTRVALDGAIATAEQAVPLGDADRPQGIAVDGGGGNLWISSRANDRLIRVGLDDPANDQEFFDVGANPKGVAVTDGAVWVANADDSSVTRLDLDAGETENTKVGGTPRDVVEGADRIWVSNGKGYVSALDPADGSKLGKVELADSEPEDIAYDGKRLWVTTGKTGTVIPIDPS